MATDPDARIGLYKSFSSAIDEGWTRWILEAYEFPYQSLHDQDIREADLSDYDVILFPHQEPNQIEQGLGDSYPEQYRGGLGKEGMARLRQFTSEGGTVVFLGAALDCRFCAGSWVESILPRD